ncbi:Zinc finger C-x8-C-x5-C-x3-H type domain containing protein [Babesia bovis T2Bo]|uniref:Zinc finger C-x8-C-x5-C-x3-H type domain containing protein n=1 Tax=Babesia bovis TaxID=5865 RepID=A7APX4_BABBO|nr:Zinc finger C-x8-C-x5-C-x3-H type domain containing protein [Babesia bovis T2Bo]EDO08608.1 Zinc finger C-x8-C-x5-C-x3-H type domain containing protein [Babesia bovis T2Bo]|eukprot:XP_001612176.1 Zinc finger C-x8-C-x5-C-x3-H type domain containing protein [Babesia bovis T2Bo]
MLYRQMASSSTMADARTCTVDEYYNCDSDSTPIDLPATLTELLDDLSIPGSLSSRYGSDCNDGSSIPSMRQSIEDASVDIATEHVTNRLSELKFPSSTLPHPDVSPFYIPLPVRSVPISGAPYQHMRSPICRFQQGHAPTTVYNGMHNQVPGYYPKPINNDLTPFTEAANCYERTTSDCEKSVGQRTVYSSENHEWDEMTRGLSTSVSTLSGIQDGYEYLSPSVDATLRNMQTGFGSIDYKYMPNGSMVPHPREQMYTIINGQTPDHGGNDKKTMKQVEFSILSSAKLNAANEFRRTSLCKYWQRGICQNIDCNFAHGKKELKGTVGVWKTTLCHHWKNGTCRIGIDCRHAHGEEELQPKNVPLNVIKNKLLNTILRDDIANNRVGANSSNQPVKAKMSSLEATKEASSKELTTNSKPKAESSHRHARRRRNHGRRSSK